MVEGKILIIIQARMGSSRLPGKVLKLINGNPLIFYLLKRVEQSGFPIIVATSENPENNELENYVKSLGYLVYRGSENNVLERFYKASKLIDSDFIIRLTADNPLVDGNYIKERVYSLKDFDKRSYFSLGLSKTYPLGTSFELFSTELLNEAFTNQNDPIYQEHVTPYIVRNVPGDIKIFTHALEKTKSSLRLTVDTLEDFNLISTLIEKYNCFEKSLIEIIEIIDNNPYLQEVNKHIQQIKI